MLTHSLASLTCATPLDMLQLLLEELPDACKPSWNISSRKFCGLKKKIFIVLIISDETRLFLARDSPMSLIQDTWKTSKRDIVEQCLDLEHDGIENKTSKGKRSFTSQSEVTLYTALAT